MNDDLDSAVSAEESQRPADEMPPERDVWFALPLSVVAGILLAVAFFSSTADVLTVTPYLAAGGVIAVALWMQRLLRQVGLLAGFLAGLNGAALSLLLWPPCRGVEDLRLEMQGKVPETSCVRFDDMNGMFLWVVLGSVLIVALLFLHRMVGRRGADGGGQTAL